MIYRQTNKLSATIIYLFLAVWSVIVIFPMIWVIMTSFKTDQEIFFSPWLPPARLMWDNFARALIKANIGRYFINSMIVILPSIFFTLLFSTMAGYVLARYQFPGNRVIFYAFMGGMLFPVMLALVAGPAGPLSPVRTSLHRRVWSVRARSSWPTAGHCSATF